MVKDFGVLFNLVYLDEVTGLYNTRYLNYVLDQEIERARASFKPFAVLFIDLDRFKKVNDNFGHVIGTQVLNGFGGLLKKLIREKDAVFRYGGDEFVVVLSECCSNSAQKIAERIRSSIEQMPFLQNETLEVFLTASIGVAVYPDNGSSKVELIEAADQAMYAAKKTSRNSVSLAWENPGLSFSRDLKDPARNLGGRGNVGGA